MNNLWTRFIGDKREWRAMEARAAALPRDHRIVHGEIKRYLWRFASGDASEILTVLGGVLQSFESAAAQGESVLSVTG